MGVAMDMMDWTMDWAIQILNLKHGMGMSLFGRWINLIYQSRL